MEYDVHEAKAHFSRLLQKVAIGEDVIIVRDGVPIARLVPLETALKPRKLGLYSGKIWMAGDFDAPLPPDFSVNLYSQGPARKKSTENK